MPRLKSRAAPIAILSLILLCLATTAPAAAQSASPSTLPDCGVTIAYLGLDNVQLQYGATGCSLPINSKVRLDVSIPGQGTTTLVPFSDAATFAGTYHHTGLIPSYGDQYTYSLTIKTPDDTIWTGIGEQAPIFTGWVGGTLLWDESLDHLPYSLPSIKASSVVVPAGRTLTLGAVRLDIDDYNSIQVYGDLGIGSSTDLWGRVDFHVPEQISWPPPHASFYFQPGSQGSMVENGTLLEAHVATGNLDRPVSIHNVVSATVTATSGAVDAASIQQLVLNGPAVATASHVPYVMITDPAFTGKLTAESSGLFTQDSPATLAGAAEVHVKDGQDMEASLQLTGTASLVVENSLIGALSLDFGSSSAPTAKISGSRVHGGIEIAGGSAQISNNQMYGGVALVGASAASITDNVLVGAVRFTDEGARVSWGAPGGPTPTISGNSFIGPSALETDFVMTRTIAIGTNYYGDSAGPLLSYLDNVHEHTFLGSRGGKVQMVYFADGLPHGFDLTPAATTGRSFDDSGVFPLFWLQGYVIGQNVLTHRSNGVTGAMQLDKETLVSLDIVTSAPDITGARVYADFDGQRIYAPPIRFHRDRAAYTSNEQYRAYSTANIILPAVHQSTYPGHQLVVYLDLSGVSGPDSGRPQTNYMVLVNTFLGFYSPPWRPFRATVVPIQFHGYCNGSANPSTVTNNLLNDLPAMFMLRPQDVVIDQSPRSSLHCGSAAAASGTALAMELGADLAAGTALGRALSSAGSVSVPDRIVAVVPKGLLGSGIDGANSPGTRGVLVVDESSASGALHEMGHSLGLNLKPEQYVDYPPDGLPVSDLTAFAPVGRTGLAGDRGRIAHFPYATDPWARTPEQFDIMGGVPSVWPLPSSFSAFSTYFQGLRVQDAKPAPASAPPRTPTDQTWRHLFFSGVIEPDPAGDGLYRLRSGTVNIFDLGPYDPPIHSVPQNPVCNWYRLRYYDASDNVVADYPLSVFPPDTEGRPIYEFDNYYALGIPESAVRLALTHEGDNQLLYERRRADSLDTPFLSPAAGSTLGANLTMSWPATSQPVERFVWFSRDGGSTWEPTAGTVQGNSWTTSSSFLPAGDQISIRVFASDGFRMQEARVDGLHIPNRQPTVSITAPPDGARALPGTTWMLHASASDIDGALGNGTWSSSLDGVLGQGPDLEAVLSSGDHTLSYAVTDSGGLSASAAVHVSVGAVAAVDLALPDDALHILAAGRDPSDTRPVALTTGMTHTVVLQVQGGGAPVTATVALTVTAPGSSPILIGREALRLEPYTASDIAATYVPPAEGDYLFVARIENSTLPDPSTANDEMEWTYSTRLPPVLTWHTTYLPLTRR